MRVAHRSYLESGTGWHWAIPALSTRPVADGTSSARSVTSGATPCPPRSCGPCSARGRHRQPGPVPQTGQAATGPRNSRLGRTSQCAELSVAGRTVKLGTTFTATQQAISLGDTQTPGITVGIRRLGFTVVASQPPRTGICRIAGSATCSFLLLAPHETQAYTLTLAPTTAGTFQLTGWTTQPIAGGSGGTVQTVTITVTP